MKKSFKRRLYVVLTCLILGLALPGNELVAKSLLASTQISLDDGLPHTDVSAITQDGNGYIWMGTYSGICRYDGVSVVTYDQINSDLESSRVSALYYSSNGYLFIGTETTGVCVLDTRSGKFLGSVKVPMNNVHTIAEGPDGDIWIGTSDGVSRLSYGVRGSDISSWSLGKGVFGLCFEKGSTILLAMDDGVFSFDPESGARTPLLKGMFCSSVVESWNGDLYVTTNKGSFRRREGSFSRLDERPSRSSCVDTHGSVYISTANGCILKYGRDGSLLDEYKVLVAGSAPVQEMNISSIFFDRSSVMWVGTFGDGCLKCGKNAHRFNYYVTGENSDEKMIASDSKGRFWISSHDGLLFVLHPDKTMTKVHGGSIACFEGAVISAFLEDSGGNVWLGSWTHGFIRIPSSGVEAMAHGKPFPVERWVNTGSSIYKFAEDGRGFMWISSGSGVLRYDISSDRITDTYRYDIHNEESVPNNFTTDVMVVENGDGYMVWTGSRLGITRFFCNSDGSVGKIRQTVRNHSEHSLMGEFVAAFLKDSRDRIWVSTLGGGLNRLTGSPDADTLKFEHYNMSNCDFPNNELESVVEDSGGNLWIGGNGLMMFNPEDLSVRRYTKEDGLQSNVFKIWAAAKTPDGQMAFGGINGFNVFDPGDISVAGGCPPVYVTGAMVNNMLYDDMDSAVLSCRQNNISFTFAALDYENPRTNRYRYMLTGADKQWRYCDGISARASYLNLRPGKYSFTVYGAGSGGLWNENPAVVNFRIKPPVYAGVIAIAFYILTALALFVAITIYRKRQSERERKLELEHQLKEEESQRNMNELKLHTDFLHEIKTPLTLITTPVEEMLQNPNLGKSTLARLKLVSQSTRILNKYIEELTDLRQMDNGKVRLKVSRSDFRKYVWTLVSMFQPVADSRNITMDLSGISGNPLPLTFDKDQMTKVITNLMSNALKFSPKNGGLVKVGVWQEDERVCLSFSNIGVGILPDDIESIFDRFHQGRNNDRGGMGIGLAISKHIVQMHGGDVNVSSVPGGETVFTVRLPLGEEHFLEEDFDRENVEESGIVDFSPVVDQPEDNRPLLSVVDREYTVLVVDDNESLLSYLATLLGSRYNVIMARNGQQGYEKAIADQPDVIVSDVLMPKMNGIELCSRIKNNEDTSHIPVILLTAKALPVHKIEGYQSLADDYITKPFDSSVLVSRIDGLIGLREKMKEHMRSNVSLDPRDITVTPADEKFLRRCISMIEKNMSNPAYGVEELSADLGMSRPTMYRKVKAVTGQSAVSFVRSIRLKRAAQLLDSGSCESISEVMTQVGFSNSPYFSKKFKEAFGVLPKEYKQSKQ